ncbi:MAG: rhodanese-like domain-containing protein [Deltaproteobacteria bacterium]|nr:rhodanese-like domain-containing protein [Deltaproteobacteria bacterium]MBW2259294.1 rhodanese-like domain-containing protein [Deltaproteobacteria bacterium]
MDVKPKERKTPARSLPACWGLIAACVVVAGWSVLTNADTITAERAIDGRTAFVSTDTETRQREGSLYIKADAVLPRYHQPNGALIVDVRSQTAFKNIRIPGAVNMPAYALVSGSFLKSRALVLTNRGYDCAPLERACRALLKSGRKEVSILYGGLQAWCSNGGPLHGDHFARERIDRIGARDFFLDSRYDDVIVLDAAKDRDSHVSGLMPKTLSLPYGENSHEAFKNGLSGIRSERGGSFTTLLVFNSDGRYPAEMSQIVNDAGFDAVFFLEGGGPQLHEYLKFEARLKGPHSEKRSTSDCATCP